MKTVWIQYHPGDCGTFLSWFCNQHKHYQKTNTVLKLHDPVPNEVTSPVTEWVTSINTIQEQIDKKDLDSSANYAFKSIGHHNISSFLDSKKYQQQIKKLIPNVFNRTVICYTTDQHIEIFANRMTHYFDTFENHDDAKHMYKHRLSEQQDLLKCSLEYWQPEDVHALDVGKLLLEQDPNEYQKLIDFLDTTPNPLWNTIINHYKTVIFEYTPDRFA